MLINLFILVLSIFDPYNHKDGRNDSLIDWSANRRLSWEDFKARPDGASVNAALTSTNINIDYSFNNHEFRYKIRCQFDPSKSWGRIKNDYILSHEQAHFDIAEIHARLLNKALKDYRFNVRTASKDIGNIYQQLMNDHRIMQEKYDDETNYSRNEEKQREWKKKINQSLEELKEFSLYK